MLSEGFVVTEPFWGIYLTLYKQLVEMAGGLPDTDAARRMFTACDTSGDGQLCKEEVSAVLDGLKVRD